MFVDGDDIALGGFGAGQRGEVLFQRLAVAGEAASTAFGVEEFGDGCGDDCVDGGGKDGSVVGQDA